MTFCRVVLVALVLSPSAAWLAQSPRAAAVGAIRGRVEIRQPLMAIERRPAVASVGAPIARGTAERRPAVIYLETAPRGAFEREEARARLDQRDETFVPHVLAITVGTTVDFPNNDRTYHNVFSLSKEKRFDLGRYAVGLSKSVLFDRPGVVRVFCDIHSHMNAFILVFAHRFFAVTDDEGRYRIEGVPPGTYNVAEWYEGIARETRAVTIPDAGGPVEANFSVK